MIKLHFNRTKSRIQRKTQYHKPRHTHTLKKNATKKNVDPNVLEVSCKMNSPQITSYLSTSEPAHSSNSPGFDTATGTTEQSSIAAKAGKTQRMECSVHLRGPKFQLDFVLPYIHLCQHCNWCLKVKSKAAKNCSEEIITLARMNERKRKIELTIRSTKTRRHILW